MLVYKILREAEWAEFERTGVFSGSVDDSRDGFIHFSTRDQMPGTLTKHYAGAKKVVIAAADTQAIKNDLKWEVSRNGAEFPHLYSSLPFSALTGVWHIVQGKNGFDLAALDGDA